MAFFTYGSGSYYHINFYTGVRIQHTVLIHLCKSAFLLARAFSVCSVKPHPSSSSKFHFFVNFSKLFCLLCLFLFLQFSYDIFSPKNKKSYQSITFSACSTIFPFLADKWRVEGVYEVAEEALVVLALPNKNLLNFSL